MYIADYNIVNRCLSDIETIDLSKGSKQIIKFQVLSICIIPITNILLKT